MLCIAALRLAAVEALAPTGSIATDGPWPTMARHHVYDSAVIAIEDLDDGEPYTPTLTVYTEEARISRRGETASSTFGDPRVDLIVVAELSERADDEGTPFVDAVVDGDAKTRLVLDALVGQVRSCLTRAPSAAVFRRILKSVDEIRVEQFALPNFGIRYLRSTVTLTCSIADDKYTDQPGLPEPLRSFSDGLPEGSYAKSKLGELSVLFEATTREALSGIRISAEVNSSAGPDAAA